VAPRVAIGLTWIGIVVVTIGAAFATRSRFAEVNGLGGFFIVVGCSFVALVSTFLVRRPMVLILVGTVAAAAGLVSAWSVLHDESSTAALGVFAPPLLSGVVAAIGIGIGALAGAWRTDTTTP
jgi:hypothetical protein